MVQLADFIQLLDSKSLLQIKQRAWELIDVYHGSGCLEHYGETEYPRLRKKFDSWRDKAGVYAYFQEDVCVYIGICQNLRERMYQHLLEAGNVWGHARYREGFGHHCGKLKLYFLPLGGDGPQQGGYLRSIVEKILQVHYKPKIQSLKI